jgi:hypothetical protein
MQSECSNIVTSSGSGVGVGEPEMMELNEGVNVDDNVFVGMVVTGTSTTRVTSWVTKIVAN